MNLGELEGSEEKNRQYTQDDFLYTTAPYEEVYQYKDEPFQHDRHLSIMCGKAAAVGIQQFQDPIQQIYPVS